MTTSSTRSPRAIITPSTESSPARTSRRFPPNSQAPPKTEAYAKYVAELSKREQALKSFVSTKHAELVGSSKSRAAEYLVAGQKALDQPTTEEFMLLADGADLNPMMVIRWQSFLARTRKEKDAVFAPWHALAPIRAEEFAAKLPDVLAHLKGTANRIVLEALAEANPKSLTDVATVYSRLLNAQDKKPGAEWDAVRAVFLRPDSPPHVPLAPFGDLGLVPDRPSQAKLQEVRNAFENWLNTGAGAPPRAMSLEDAGRAVRASGLPAREPQQPRRAGGAAVPDRALHSRRINELRLFLYGSATVPRGLGPARTGESDREQGQPADRAGAGEPGLDDPHGVTAGFDPQRLRLPQRSPDSSRAARRPGLVVHRVGVVDQGAHRRIMLSSAYQQVSEDRPGPHAVDPENALYWRMNRRRLDFESLRDATLAVSGRLDPTIGGPAKPSATDPATPRRTLYTKVDRLNLPGLLRTFDFPDPNASSARRDQSTVAPQALFLMNHPFVIASAKALTDRVEVSTAKGIDAKVDRLYRLLYGRSPTAEESALAREFVTGARAEGVAWQAFAQALLMANEFAFVD